VCVQVYIYNIVSSIISTQSTLLVQLGLCRCDHLHRVFVGLGVDKLLDALDLQVSFFVGADVCDFDRFEGCINPDGGGRRLRELWGRYQVK